MNFVVRTKTIPSACAQISPVALLAFVENRHFVIKTHIENRATRTCERCARMREV